MGLPTSVDWGGAVEDETPQPVTMETIVDWSYDDLRHTKEREAKLEWGAARPLSPEAKACELCVPFAWLFEKLTTARPEAPTGRGLRLGSHLAPNESSI